MSQYPCFEVLSYQDPEERKKWRSICQGFKDIDIFYYPEYLYLFELKGDGKAQCFVYYYDEKGIVIFPFLRRQINELDDFSDISNNMIDISSPYGYSGYLRNNDQVDMDKFYINFENYCKENNVISEFIRFHPLIDNFSYSPGEIQSNKVNDTVVIDLTLTPDAIWKNFTSACRNKIKKAKKLRVTVAQDERFEFLEEFCKLYTITMQRLRAQEYYLFSIDWFHHALELLKDNLALFHVRYSDQVIMSALFIFTDNYIHYYLSGSDYKMSHTAANNLLLYEVALWAKNRDIKFFNLGGGFQPEDSLFRFKASFSPNRTPFYTGNVIHNHEFYQYLCARRVIAKEQVATDTHFFPSYRSPMRQVSPYTTIKGRTIIIGASGHARVCSDILTSQGREIVGFCDDDRSLMGSSVYNYQVLGGIKAIIPLLLENEMDYIIAIGDNADRKNIAIMVENFIKRRPVNAIHPSAIISPRAIMGFGNFIAPGVIINADTKLGSYTIINTGATLDHDNIIQDFAQILPWM